jgi:hypothetical protein
VMAAPTVSIALDFSFIIAMFLKESAATPK